jgi:FtsH-binding integral membrane protein
MTVLWLFLLTLPVLFLLSIGKIPKVLKFLLLTALSVIFGVILYPGMYPGTKRYVTDDMIYSTLSVTVGVFTAMTLLGFYVTSRNVELLQLSNFLFMSLIALIIAGLVLYVFPSMRLYSIYVVAGTIIFSLYTMVDTNMMLTRRYGVIDSVTNFYLDFMNLFLYMLSYNNRY